MNEPVVDEIVEMAEVTTKPKKKYDHKLYYARKREQRLEYIKNWRAQRQEEYNKYMREYQRAHFETYKITKNRNRNAKAAREREFRSFVSIFENLFENK